MRAAAVLSILVVPSFLSGCGPEAVGIAAGVSGASIVVFHRAPIDMVVSAVSGRNCSVVHLDRREQYCHPREKPPEPPPFCTRSLGVADCWEDASKLPGHPREIADGPRALTTEQENDRTSRWPGLW